jgi:hypothetical protein
MRPLRFQPPSGHGVTASLQTPPAPHCARPPAPARRESRCVGAFSGGRAGARAGPCLRGAAGQRGIGASARFWEPSGRAAAGHAVCATASHPGARRGTSIPPFDRPNPKRAATHPRRRRPAAPAPPGPAARRRPPPGAPPAGAAAARGEKRAGFWAVGRGFSARGWGARGRGALRPARPPPRSGAGSCVRCAGAVKEVAASRLHPGAGGRARARPVAQRGRGTAAHRAHARAGAPWARRRGRRGRGACGGPSRVRSCRSAGDVSVCVCVECVCVCV